jgi:hypothetical protein
VHRACAHSADITSEGLDLSIVKQLYDSLDARLELESKRGKSTLSHVILSGRYEATETK